MNWDPDFLATADLPLLLDLLDADYSALPLLPVRDAIVDRFVSGKSVDQLRQLWATPLPLDPDEVAGWSIHHRYLRQ